MLNKKIYGKPSKKFLKSKRFTQAEDQVNKILDSVYGKKWWIDRKIGYEKDALLAMVEWADKTPDEL